jgi:probable HAF family extracellular repeat protein
MLNLRCSRRWLAAGAIISLSAAPLHAQAPAYRLTILDDPTRHCFMEARAINKAGEVVGVAVKKTAAGEEPHWRAFLYRKGKYIDLGLLKGCKYSEATGINDRGQIVGVSSPLAGVSYAFLWENGKMRRLPANGNARANAINNDGLIVGTATTPQGDVVAATWTPSATAPTFLPTYSRAVAVNDAGDIVTVAGAQSYVVNGANTLRVGTLGGGDTMAMAINGHGAVAGVSNTATDLTHAFLWNRGAIADVSTIKSLDGTAAVLSVDSVNSFGTMVGTVRDGFDTRAMVFTNGHATNLNHLIPRKILVLDVARAVNDHGQIIGQGHMSDFFASFLLTPLAAPPVPPVSASIFKFVPPNYAPPGPALNAPGHRHSEPGA